MNRSRIVMGAWHTVECAVRADGTSPAREFLDLLKAGMWDKDPEAEGLPHDEQIKDWARFAHVMKYLAVKGQPEDRDDVNYLGYGIWEFRVYDKRLAFYDTDGRGAYEPKPKIRDRAQAPYPDADYWWFPELDHSLRLANAWPKLGQKADPLDIEEAVRIREEDLSYDRS